MLGLQAIHEQKFMHRDMKLPNILLHFPTLTKEWRESPDFDMKSFLETVKFVSDGKGD